METETETETAERMAREAAEWDGLTTCDRCSATAMKGRTLDHSRTCPTLTETEAPEAETVPAYREALGWAAAARGFREVAADRDHEAILTEAEAEAAEAHARDLARKGRRLRDQAAEARTAAAAASHCEAEALTEASAQVVAAGVSQGATLTRITR